MNITSVDQLAHLRRSTGLSALDMDLNPMLQGHLPMYGVRFGLWALQSGGTLTLSATAAVDSMVYQPGRWSCQLLVQLVCKAMAGLGELVSCDPKSRCMICRRVAPTLARGPWSAAVMFSGQDSELPLLARCVQGLREQPELRDGGEIVVCGPAQGEAAVRRLPDVAYMVLETPTAAGRFLIGAKKNLAMRALRHDRLLVCHTRMLLRPGCLAALPQEFDLITPQVQVQGSGGWLPYLDLGHVASHSVALHSNRPLPPMHYRRQHWLRLLGSYYAYVDGGLFCVNRALAMAQPMSDSVAWGEAEDAEWAVRLAHAGRVVELGLDSVAESMTCKTQRYAQWGHLGAYRAASAAWQHLRALGNRLTPKGTA